MPRAFQGLFSVAVATVGCFSAVRRRPASLRRLQLTVTCALYVALSCTLSQAAARDENRRPDQHSSPLALRGAFIENKGQVDERAQFYLQSINGTVWLTREGVLFDVLRDRQV